MLIGSCCVGSCGLHVHTLYTGNSELGFSCPAFCLAVYKTRIHMYDQQLSWQKHQSMLYYVVGSNATQDSSFFFVNDSDVLLESRFECFAYMLGGDDWRCVHGVGRRPCTVPTPRREYHGLRTGDLGGDGKDTRSIHQHSSQDQSRWV